MTTDISGLTGYTQSNTGSSNSSRHKQYRLPEPVGGHEHLSDPVNHAVEISGSA